jgi:DNA modification methylase
VAAFESVLVGAGFRVRSHAVWVKNNHGQGDLGTLAPKHELILHATLGDAALYHRDPDVFVFDKVNTERHPTEKPQGLLERLIEISTVRGDLIADPFGGVASTAAAARATGRAYWSCELDEKYWKVGETRLSDLDRGSPTESRPAECLSAQPTADERSASTKNGQATVGVGVS